MAISPLGKDQIIQNHKNDFDSKKQTDKGISFEDAFGSFFNEINELQTKTNDSIEHLSIGKCSMLSLVFVCNSLISLKKLPKASSNEIPLSVCFLESKSFL